MVLQRTRVSYGPVPPLNARPILVCSDLTPFMRPRLGPLAAVGVTSFASAARYQSHPYRRTRDNPAAQPSRRPPTPPAPPRPPTPPVHPQAGSRVQSGARMRPPRGVHFGPDPDPNIEAGVPTITPSTLLASSTLVNPFVRINPILPPRKRPKNSDNNLIPLGTLLETVFCGSILSEEHYETVKVSVPRNYIVHY